MGTVRKLQALQVLIKTVAFHHERIDVFQRFCLFGKLPMGLVEMLLEERRHFWGMLHR
jgi:hypothetical protein